MQAVVLGEGPDRPMLEAAIAASSLQPYLQLLGQRADVESFQRRAKFIVLTSRWEGVSIAMLEGMAFGGVPIVADVGDLCDYADATTGACLNEHDIESFADTIEFLMANREAWQARSCASRRRIEHTSSKSAVIGKWKRLLTDLSGPAQLTSVSEFN